jgi:acetylxylan esterase
MRARLVLLVGLLVGLVLAAPAQAASLQKVNSSDWRVAGLPSYVSMYIYVPDKLAERPPILVGSHHCRGTGPGTFGELSSLVSLADNNGFIMIFPEATGHNCWDVGSSRSLKHDGGGDTHAIAQMVRYTLAKYAADASRVYAFGGSSGAMMTQALLGIYPDLFTAGVAVAGVPCGCWAESYSGDQGANPQWSGPCAGGQVSKSAQQWGDLVRSMYPGYDGPRPRIQLWHGTADTTINYKNLTESIKAWTNVLGLTTAPTSTDTPKANNQRQVWRGACGQTELEAWSVQGAGHGVNWDQQSVIAFLELDKVGELGPRAAACPKADAGTSHGGGDASQANDAGPTSDGEPRTDGATVQDGGQPGGSSDSGEGATPTRGRLDAGASQAMTASTDAEVAPEDDSSSDSESVNSPGGSGLPKDAGGCALAARSPADIGWPLGLAVGWRLRRRRSPSLRATRTSPRR